MMQWLNYHGHAIKLVLTRMRHNLLSSFMICLVIGVAISLPGLFYVSVDNLSKLTDHMQDETEISLFLKLDASAKTVSAIEQELAANQAIKHYRLVNKDEAWQRLQAQSETNNKANRAILQLSKNPLPDAFFVQAKSAEPAALEALKSSLQTIPGVEQALLNTEWAQRLSILLKLAEKVIFFIAALLAIALLVIIGNTVHMQILTQKDEIEVSNLMGATSSFIRTPFLYAGMSYGFFGGLLAILMMMGILQMFNYSVAQISSLYSSDFRLSLVNSELFLIIIALAIFIGWLGSYIAVTRSIAAVVHGHNSR
jgi:cell division transport system permease protein